MNNIKILLLAYVSAATLTFYVLTYIDCRKSLIKSQRQTEYNVLRSFDMYDYIFNNIKKFLKSVFFPVTIATDIIPYIANTRNSK